MKCLKVSYTPYRASKSVFYTLCTRSPAFNCIKMAWVAGLGCTAAKPSRSAKNRIPACVTTTIAPPEPGTAVGTHWNVSMKSDEVGGRRLSKSVQNISRAATTSGGGQRIPKCLTQLLPFWFSAQMATLHSPLAVNRL